MEDADGLNVVVEPHGVVEMHRPAAGNHEGVADAVLDEGRDEPVDHPDLVVTRCMEKCARALTLLFLEAF